MGRGDNKRTRKTLQRKNQAHKKAREKRKAELKRKERKVKTKG